MPEQPQNAFAEDNAVGAGDYEAQIVKDFPDWRSAFDFVYNILLSHRHQGLDQTKPLSTKRFSLKDAATIDVDCRYASHFYVTLAGNRTLNNPTGAKDGQRLVFEFIQDSTGSRTIAFGSKFAFGTSITTVTLTTTATKRDFVGVLYSAQDDKFYIVATAPGY